MTHQEECTVLDDLTDLLIEHGPSAMASALATLMNHAMQIEREQTLQAESHQRTADRQGYANGFKPKTIRTRVGEGSHRPAATTTPRVGRSIPRASNGVSGVNGP